MAETSGILRQLAAHAREDARIYREKGSGPATRADAETVADAMDIAAGARERLADALDEITRLRAEVARLEGEATEREAILSAMYCAATQQPVSDFEESFPAVRAVADLAAEKTQAEAERDALRAHLAEWQQAAKAIQRDKDSEQDRRVAAQEAITLRWEPQVAALRATLAAVREKLEHEPDIQPDCDCHVCRLNRGLLALLDGTAEGGEQ